MRRLALLVGLGIPTCACAIDDREPETPGYAIQIAPPVAERRAQAGEIMSNREAADVLARALCNREARCEHIGTNEKFPSAPVCESRLQAEHVERLGECGQGVDAATLDACVDDVASHSCVHEIDDLQRVLPCSTLALCID